MSSHIDSINQAVALQYNTFPFPDYGLFLPIRWQEAYASHSSFSQILRSQHEHSKPLRPVGDVLIAGCGDIFPSVIAHWESRHQTLHAIDISKVNIMRARIRCLLSLQSCHFQRMNLDIPLHFADSSFSHIDAYGVLHHLANPRTGLENLSRLLTPGGTLRLMVYNRVARTWIHHIQKIFSLLQLSPFIKEDRKDALFFLEALARECPALRDRLLSLLPEIRAKPSRLVDTFLHAREARLDLNDWRHAIESCKLKILGLFDRYAELDDLPNPLYQVPRTDQLAERCDDRRFENNWEFYLCKEGQAKATTSISLSKRVKWRSPPSSWFSYQETRGLPWMLRRELWNSHLSYYFDKPELLSSETLNKLEPDAIQRLLRIGAIWPSALPLSLQQDLMTMPLHKTMECPHIPPPQVLISMNSSTKLLQSILLRKKRDPKLIQLIAKRLDAAQSHSN